MPPSRYFENIGVPNISIKRLPVRLTKSKTRFWSERSVWSYYYHLDTRRYLWYCITFIPEVIKDVHLELLDNDLSCTSETVRWILIQCDIYDIVLVKSTAMYLHRGPVQTCHLKMDRLVKWTILNNTGQMY